MMPVAGRQPKKCTSKFKLVQYEKSGEHEPGENSTRIHANLDSSAVESKKKTDRIVCVDVFNNRNAAGLLQKIR